MGAPACDIPAWMVRALDGEGVIEVRQPRLTTAAMVGALAAAAYAGRHVLHRNAAHGGRVAAVAWGVVALVLLGAGLRLVTVVAWREPVWAVGAAGVTTAGWWPHRRWRVGAATDPAWRWDEDAWRLRPLPRSPELRVRERQLRFVPTNRPAHAS